MAQTVEVKRNERTTAPAPMPASGVDTWQSFRNEMQRFFDQFWNRGSFPSLLPRFFDGEPMWRSLPAAGFASPAVDVAEDDKAYHITAELPGLSEKDIDVTLSGDILTIKGEKRDQ